MSKKELNKTMYYMLYEVMGMIFKNIPKRRRRRLAAMMNEVSGWISETKLKH